MTHLTRRSMLRGAGLATVAAAATTLPALPSIAGTLPMGGCMHCAQARAFRGFSVDMGSSRRDNPRLIASTGDTETDHFLGAALARLATTFDVRPTFSFFDDGDSIDAFATRRQFGANDHTGSVLLGKRLFRQAMALEGDHGLSVIAICAHEFGHIYQMYNGYNPKFIELDQKTMRPCELHADFLAGFYMAQRKKDHPEFDLHMVGQTFYNLGDNAFTASDHHGTSEERAAAITAGYQTGKTTTSIGEAAAAGLSYVRQIS